MFLNVVINACCICYHLITNAMLTIQYEVLINKLYVRFESDTTFTVLNIIKNN
jgi:hypothetical protein